MVSQLSVHKIAELQESPFDSGTTTPRLPRTNYRPAKTLPYELREHCIIYFEEGLYVQALNLLLSLTTAGGSTSALKPAFIPPPQHLALISTLSVHPSLTTRAKSPDELDAANLALKYLGLIEKTVGPLHTCVNDAFAFSSPATTSRRGGSSRRKTGDNSPENEDLDEIAIDLAHVTSLWARADDFWHIVGWGFNCSVVHKKRWPRWKLWLQHMTGVLEDDWQARSDKQREESLIIKYLNPEDRGSVGEKRIARAIFADGTSRALAEFHEIWKNETKERKVNDEADAMKKVTVKINIEDDNYGDYMKSSSDEIDDELPDYNTSPLSPELSTVPTTDGTLILGGSSALQLRLRLLGLLSAVAIELPHKFTTLSNLYDVYLTHIRPFPTPTFALIISPPYLHHFSPSAASSLIQYTAASLISSSAPLPKEDDLTIETLETCYLPWSANTTSISDNAKLGACVETLVRLFDVFVGLRWTERLERYMEEGIKAREDKGTKERKRKGEASGGTESDKAWLRDSGERIRRLLRSAKAGKNNHT